MRDNARTTQDFIFRHTRLLAEGTRPDGIDLDTALTWWNLGWVRQTANTLNHWQVTDAGRELLRMSHTRSSLTGQPVRYGP
jgi:hypothetical protein